MIPCPVKILGNNVIYGEWSDVGGYQFIISHPNTAFHNSEFVSVFMLAGYDYGGGVSRMAKVPIEKFYEVLQPFILDYDNYQCYKAVDDLVKEYEES